MKHRLFAIIVLCLTLFLSACQQETISPTTTTAGGTEPPIVIHYHEYTDGEKVEATCTDNGYTLKVCSCGISYKGDLIRARGHKYAATEVVAPTETEKGYTVYTCGHCGVSYKGDEKDPVPAPQPTEPIPPPASTMELSQWYPGDRDTMSYDEFFSEDRTFSQNTGKRWLMPFGEGYAYFSVYTALSNRYLSVSSSATTSFYIVPNSNSLPEGYRGIGNDGRYYYYSAGNSLNRLDMTSGETSQLATFDKLHSACLYGDDLMIYIATVDSSAKLHRIYLPELKLEVLLDNIDVRAPHNWFTLDWSVKTSSAISWTTLNPEFIDALLAEAKNPHSQYKNACPQLWDNPDALYAITALPTTMMQDIQDETGIKCQIRYTLNPSTGEITETLGIIDNCWHGSGVIHDHFDMNTYDVDPVLALTDPVSIPQIIPPEDPNVPITDQNGYLPHYVATIDGISKACRFQEGVYFPISDTPVKSCTVTPDGLVCMTPDNTIIQMNWEGKVLSTIYTAQFGSLRSLMYYEKGILYFMDGIYILELDLPNRSVRTLIKAPYCGNFYPYEIEGQTILYVESSKGMSFGGWEINIADQTIKYNYHL